MKERAGSAAGMAGQRREQPHEALEIIEEQGYSDTGITDMAERPRPARAPWLR